MAAADHFCLRWNNYQTSMVTELDVLRSDEHLVDVTLSCEGKFLRAHKLILSACSSYFKKVFRDNPCKHPIVIMKDVSYEDIESLLSFIYQGVVYISEKRLSTFLQTAELLQIRGLVGVASDTKNEEPAGIVMPQCSAVLRTRRKPSAEYCTLERRSATNPTNAIPCKRKKLPPTENEPTSQKAESEDEPIVIKTEVDPDKLVTGESGECSKSGETSSEDAKPHLNISECDDEEGVENNNSDDDHSSMGSPHSPGAPAQPSLLPNLARYANAIDASGGGSNLFNFMASTLPPSEPNISLSGSHLAQCGNCPHCGQKYSNQSALKYHVRLMHSDLTNRMCCFLCPMSFTQRDEYKAHMWETHKARC